MLSLVLKDARLVGMEKQSKRKRKKKCHLGKTTQEKNQMIIELFPYNSRELNKNKQNWKLGRQHVSCVLDFPLHGLLK